MNKIQKEIFEEHRLLTALGKKYPGRFVAMVDKEVLAMGKDQFKVFEKAQKKLNNKKKTIGVYYLPGRKRHLYLLKSGVIDIRHRHIAP